VSALYNKYANDENDELEIEIFVPKSAPGCTSKCGMHLSLYDFLVMCTNHGYQLQTLILLSITCVCRRLVACISIFLIFS